MDASFLVSTTFLEIVGWLMGRWRPWAPECPVVGLGFVLAKSDTFHWTYYLQIQTIVR